MKEEPLHQWEKENNRPFGILGLTRNEGGRRFKALCIAWKGKKKFNFQPLAPVTKDWEDWYLKERGIKLCDLYYPPFNFLRTGCKGCPFAIELQEELDVLEEYLPNERKQCELIWGPVYEEYRRIGYRLRQPDEYQQIPGQMSIFDYEGVTE